MATDIEIARQAKMKPIGEIAAKLGIPDEALEPYGRTKAKIAMDWINTQADKPDGKLILVTAINPTPGGEKARPPLRSASPTGSTGSARTRACCLREPSLGPSFGMKGGAAGGGFAQVVPMEDINLHFTGDFHAITSAHNLLSALIDNHIYWGNAQGLDTRRIVWRRCST
jgi:formate--tetrahydrofolate ligase